MRAKAANEARAAALLPAWLGGIPRRWRAILLVGLLAAGAGVVRGAVALGLPLPFCLLRATTGIPCPGCGCTRSLLAWTHLDPVSALRFNPLFFLFTVAMPVWAFARLCRGSEDSAGEPASPRWRGWVSPWVLVALALLNWVYLCCSLPK